MKGINKRRSIVYTAVQPTPFIDNIIHDVINEGFDVEGWYFIVNEGSYVWKDYHRDTLHLFSWKNLFGHIRYLRNKDLVILPFGIQNHGLNLVMGTILSLFGTKIAYTSDHPNPESTKLSFLAVWVKSFLLSFEACFFPESYSCGDFYKNHFHVSSSKIAVFPYRYIAYDEIKEGKFLSEIKAPHKFRFFIASRMLERKGYVTVIKVLKRFDKEGILDLFDLDIAGSGEKFEEYKNAIIAIKSDTKFHGWVETDSYLRLLDYCDVYIHPSLWEPFGIPPLDAMYRNKIVVVSENVKSTDIFRGYYNNGIFIYKSNDDEQLALILKKIIFEKPFLLNHNPTNRQLVEKFYSSKINAAAINKVLGYVG